MHIFLKCHDSFFTVTARLHILTGHCRETTTHYQRIIGIYMMVNTYLHAKFKGIATLPARSDFFRRRLSAGGPKP